jgi:radical SAM superfamily enzyme with C-terminal helix-hairpin-helix motif
LLEGRRPGIDAGIVHTDNANPAVIADHPEEGREAVEAIASSCTSGSVLALGLESSDPAVKDANNLNSTPEQALSAIRTINEVGKARGDNGMPQLLPGLNFLGGLWSQEADSFEHDLELLRAIGSEGLLLRRINIRAALYPAPDGGSGPNFVDVKAERAFRAFKEQVRAEIDPVLLGRVVPLYSVVKGIYLETSQGHVVYGRQIGSYPVLVRLDHPDEVGSFADACITGISSRSISGFRTPFMINRVPFSKLTAIPGIGRKRAASVFRKRPVDTHYLEKELGLDLSVIEHIDTSP